LVTLPVEYDASRRAKVQLVNLGLVQPDESEAVNRVLNAAADPSSRRRVILPWL